MGIIKAIAAIVLPRLLLAGDLLRKLCSEKKQKRKQKQEECPPTATHTEPPGSHSNREPSPSTSYEYEVFLSFRGSDTRKGFADCLFQSLKDAGVRAFRDDEELRKGEDISADLKKAVEQSKFCIPIFSQNYASSKWCLKELAFMMKCRNAGNQSVLPIFYDVRPYDIRHQSGSYAKAFRKHEKDYEGVVVQEWRDALAQVGALAGWELKNVADGHQGELIKLVVKKVLRGLKKGNLRVTDTLVGIDEQVEAIMRMLDVGTRDARIVGITGIGGIGKTTLAKVIYNRVREQFECYAYIEDIQEVLLAQRNGLKGLLSLLVANLSRCEYREFTSVDDGINELECRFLDKKVLILLDNVDELEQFEALVGGVDRFGAGSRIIVTTRNRGLLRKKNVHWTYEVKALTQDHALRLFCRHAFEDGLPTDELNRLCREIVMTTGGLPLALEVIGSLLLGDTKATWEGTLAKLRRIPHEKVQDKLKISYEALKHENKQIFLDIAGFFIGMDVRIVTYLWKDCEFFPEVGIQDLLRRCLIKIGEDNKLWMHPQLRDLGREIVRQENYEEAGKRSRLWLKEEASPVLYECKGTDRVVAISVQGEEYPFQSRHFLVLPNLRFLQLEGANLIGTFRGCLPRLRWLSWRNSPLDFTPSNLPLEGLVILDLSGSKVRENSWHGWDSTQTWEKLKVLDLSSCHELKKFPESPTFPNLERLILEGCINLVEVGPSIPRMKRLTSLNLKSCLNLKWLPQELGYMEELTELFVDGTRVKEIPLLEGMKKLKTLTAKNCFQLAQIPISIGHLTSLSNLILDSSGIRELPKSIGFLTKLQRLSLNSCYSLRVLPGSIGQLTSLVELSLSGTDVARLPDSIGNLENLEVLKIDSSAINCLPTDIRKWCKLEVLNASGCHRLEGQVPADIWRLSHLKVLRLDGTNIRSIPDSISKLFRLETLHLTECQRLLALPELPLSLTSLRVSSNSKVPIPNLLDLANLKELRFIKCAELMEIPQDIAKLFKLEKLELCATNISTLPVGIGHLPHLKALSIEKCVGVEFLPNLPSSLSKLNVSYQGLLVKLPDLGKLRYLLELSLEMCCKLREITGLENLVSLTSLKVVLCQGITELDGVQRLRSLTYLEVSDCENLEKLPGLSALVGLSVLKAAGCNKLVELKGLHKLYVLKHLDISRCISMEQLPDLSCLRLLHSLSAKGCLKLREFRGLDELVCLSSLDLSGCRDIKSLPNLSKLKKLRRLDIAGCDYITEIDGLSRELQMTITLTNLEDLPKVTNVDLPIWNTKTGCIVNSHRPTCSKTSLPGPSVNFPGVTVAKIAGDITAVYPRGCSSSVPSQVVFLGNTQLPSNIDTEEILRSSRRISINSTSCMDDVEDQADDDEAVVKFRLRGSKLKSVTAEFC